MARLDARWVLVGEDFRFGRAAPATSRLLRAPRATFSVEAHARPSSVDGERGRRARGARRAGRRRSRARGARCSAGPTPSAGRVAHGDKLGRNLGFPTANIALRHKPPLSGHLRGARARPGRRAARRVWPASACARRSRRTRGRCSKCSCSISTRPIYGRRVDGRVPAQAARRGALRRPRRADAPDSRRRRAGARIFLDRAR